MFEGANMSCVYVCMYIPTPACTVSWVQSAGSHSSSRLDGGSRGAAEGDTSTEHLLQQAPPLSGMGAVVPLRGVTGPIPGLLLVVLP